MSGPPSRCARLRQRLRPARVSHLDGDRHLLLNTPALSCDLYVEQLLGDCAEAARAVLSRSRDTGRTAIADRGNQSLVACS